MERMRREETRVDDVVCAWVMDWVEMERARARGRRSRSGSACNVKLL